MGCCPASPPSLGPSAGSIDSALQETEIRQGESVQCYSKRVGNTTGLHDDSTGNPANKITQTTVVVDCTASTNMLFTLSDGSTPVSSWRIKDGDGNVLSSPWNGITISGNSFSGTFSNSVLGKELKIVVEALDSGSTVIDSRAFAFSPAKCASDNSLQFVSPLPGAIVNSKFGPRMHPIHKVMKMHTGIDMKFSDRSVADVRAAADGEIIFAGQNGGYGNTIKIKHISASGKHLCSTTYNHLAKIYVAVGQKVSASQRIGLEGTTGSSTGNHLHFEVILPNGSFTDPEPYIRGTLSVAGKTLDNGDADQTTVQSRTNTNTALTAENVKAVDGSCPNYGSTYPPDPTETHDSVPSAPSTDPFEQAWFFTMTHEVGPFWDNTYPSDPDVINGSIDTATQRKKVGYVNSAGFPGGETKFGIAQGPNPGIVVKTIEYDPAKKTGYNNYWKRGPSAVASIQPKTAVMLFDMNYLHGVGNATYILHQANITGMNDVDACAALHTAQVNFINGIVQKNPSRQAYAKGWLKRSNDLLSYALSL